MRLLPFARLVVFLRRRYVDGMMQPAVPVRPDARGFGVTVVDHPAPLEAQRRVDLAATGAIVTVAAGVLADQLAESPGPQLGPEGLAIPPRKELEQKLLHRRIRLASHRLMPPRCRIVQFAAAGSPFREEPGLSRIRRNSFIGGTSVSVSMVSAKPEQNRIRPVE